MASKSTRDKRASSTKDDASTHGKETASDATVRRQKAIQSRVDARDEEKPQKTSKKSPVQAGERAQPENPLPEQHLSKPGHEHMLNPAPRFLAPHYKGSGKLQGKVALITGGDSGIGRAVAVLFAREGADVAIVYLSEHQDAQDTRMYIDQEGRRSFAISGDVRDSAFCNEAVAQTIAAFGQLDILVNNAAFQEHCDSLADLTDVHLQETLQTNIAGYFHMARAALPHLKNGSCIINSGSETGLFGHKELLDYSATKGAIHAFTLSLASQLLPRGIRVNAVAPGPVWTPLNPADKSAEDVAKFGADSDMGRPAQPEEISPAYVFLASPVTASYVNGVVLPVMGGPRG